MRIILVLCGIAVVTVTIVGFSSSKRAKMESNKTIFVCKSCGAAWTELDRIVRIRGELPKFKVLSACPSCSDKHDEHIIAAKNNELKRLLEHQPR
jgi:RNase P subunit RPR2